MTVTELVDRDPASGCRCSRSLTPLQIREFLIHSELHQPKPGEVVFQRDEFANSLYSILDGEVGIQVDPDDPTQMVQLGAGEFFGEMALISGRRRTSTVVATKPSLLLEVDRNTMIRLVRSEPSIKQAIDDAAVVRQIKTFLGAACRRRVCSPTCWRRATVVEFKPNETLIEEGADDDSVYLIRKGSVTVSVRVGGKDVVLAYRAGRQLCRRDGADHAPAAHRDGHGGGRRPRRSASTARAFPHAARPATPSCAARSRTSSKSG